MLNLVQIVFQEEKIAQEIMGNSIVKEYSHLELIRLIDRWNQKSTAKLKLRAKPHL